MIRESTFVQHISVALVLATVVFPLSCRESASRSPAYGGRVEVIVRDDGYAPNEIIATRGEELTLVFKRTTESPCGQAVVIPEHDIRRDLPLNQPVEIAFIPTKTGRLTFMCGMNRMKGAIIVQ